MAGNKRVSGAIAAALMFTATVAATSPIGASSATTAAAAGTKPVVYLSFDDGPSLDGETSHLLDILDEYDVEATFFVVGNKLESAANQAALRRMYAAGHAVGSHSWDHSPLEDLDDTQLVDIQLAQTHDRVKAISGYDMLCFRAPWGKSRIRKDQVPIMEDFGYQLENSWQLDASEYVFTDLSPAPASVAGQIANTLATATNGNKVLLHDGVVNRSAMVAGVEQFLAAHGDDYQFRTIPGCLNSETTPSTTTPPTTTPPTSTPPTTAPPPAGPVFSGPIVNATSIADIQAASDYTASDANFLRLYHALLARNPDVAGSKYWLSLARQGSSLDDVAWSFSQSLEFTNKYGSLDDAAFVTTVYANVLGRTPDAAGYAYWLDRVQSGALSRHGVVRWMAENPEFQVAHPYRAT